MTKDEEVERLERFAAEFPEDSYSRQALLEFVEAARSAIRSDLFVPSYRGTVEAGEEELARARQEASLVRREAHGAARELLLRAREAVDNAVDAALARL